MCIYIYKMYTLKFINFPFLTTKGNRGMKMRQVMAGRLRPCVQHGSWRGVESRLRAERSPRLVITGGRMRVDSKSFRPIFGRNRRVWRIVWFFGRSSRSNIINDRSRQWVGDGCHPHRQEGYLDMSRIDGEEWISVTWPPKNLRNVIRTMAKRWTACWRLVLPQFVRIYPLVN